MTEESVDVVGCAASHCAESAYWPRPYASLQLPGPCLCPV